MTFYFRCSFYGSYSESYGWDSGLSRRSIRRVGDLNGYDRYLPGSLHNVNGVFLEVFNDYRDYAGDRSGVIRARVFADCLADAFMAFKKYCDEYCASFEVREYVEH